MDIIFIHGNYPAQFRNLAPMIGRSNHRVFFLTEREDALTDQIEGINIRILGKHRSGGAETHHYLKDTEECVIKGQAVIRALDDLMHEGVNPKIIVTHGGTGLGMFVKSFIRDAVHISYFEWYFNAKTTAKLVKDFSMDTKFMTEIRNLAILYELESCDIGVVPTQWQKEQFPRSYRHKLEVIFDGIDQNFFCPGNDECKNTALELKNRDTQERFSISENNRIISYATRGMEPLRGFPEFMRALPILLEKNSDLVAVIAGADRVAYSYQAPTHSGSWKKHLLSKIKDSDIKKRIVFTGLLNYEDYKKLLQRSNLHCYFTHPYVTSWSLFEATACGACLALNKNKATDYVAKEESVHWVTPFDHNSLARQLEESLKPENRKKAIQKSDFSLNTAMKKWENLLNRLLKPGS